MAAILTLAPELIHRIADDMEIQDVKILRLVCRLLGDILESKVLNTIFLDVNKQNASKSVEMLRSLAHSNATGAVSRSARRITIRSLSPDYDPMFCGTTFVNTSNWRASKVQDETEDCTTFEEMKSYLLQALLSLQSIRSVIWRMEHKDKPCAQNIVASALVALPQLQYLEVMLAYARISLPLQHMLNLREITLSEGGTTSSNDPFNSRTFTNLAVLIAQSPPGQLTHIQATHGYYDTVRTDSKPSLHELLDRYPQDKPPLHLSHLGIVNAFVKFDDRIAPHLRYLTSLDISNVIQPLEHVKLRRGRWSAAVNSRVVQSIIDPAVYKSRRAVGSTVDEIWNQLSVLGIWLEHIALSDVSPAFVDYLESYSGLRRLSLRARGFETEAESNALARLFYERTIPQHTRTLEHLSIEASYEGIWCFGDHNVSTISACTRLRHLGISVMADNPKEITLRNIRGVEGAIDHLIDISSKKLRDLLEIRLNIANLERNRWSLCGGASLLYYSSVTKQVSDHLFAYSVPTNTHASIPVVYVGAKTFKPVRVRAPAPSGSHDIQWEWRYRVNPAGDECFNRI